MGSVTSFAAAGHEDPNLASFGNSYQKLQEEMEEKEADPTYKPSFADFYSKADVKAVIDGQDKNCKLQPEAQSCMDGLKQLHRKQTLLEGKIKEQEQERDVLERVKKREIDQNNIKLTDLQQKIATRKSESANLRATLKQYKQQLKTQSHAMSPQNVNLLTQKIVNLQDKLKANTQLNKTQNGEISKLEAANEKLNTEIDGVCKQYNAKIDPMKQKAKLDKDAIDTQFKQFLTDFDSLDKVVT